MKWTLLMLPHWSVDPKKKVFWGGEKLVGFGKPWQDSIVANWRWDPFIISEAGKNIDRSWFPPWEPTVSCLFRGNNPWFLGPKTFIFQGFWGPKVVTTTRKGDKIKSHHTPVGKLTAGAGSPKNHPIETKRSSEPSTSILGFQHVNFRGCKKENHRSTSSPASMRSSPHWVTGHHSPHRFDGRWAAQVQSARRT